MTREPFDHLIVPRFIRPEVLESVQADYPWIEQGGSFPLSTLNYGAAFDQLSRELLGDAMRSAFAEKFGMELTDRPATLTVRGCCRPKDGKIHVDSKTKLITVLLYLNAPWEAPGGRLRLLRSEHDIEDYFAEVPPERGTLLCFRNGPTAWHGHKSFTGQRRVLQLNWVASEAAANASARRHGLSAFIKRVIPLRRAA
jgi:SM-20-related protein